MRIHSQQTHRTETINVLFKTNLPVNSRVTIGGGSLNDIDRLFAQLEVGKTVSILCQASTRERFALGIQKKLPNSSILELPDGEQCKSHESLLTVWSEFQRLQMQRSDCVVAVGGGALTDLAGFAASTYLRGIKLVLVPTTLLAQVDAGIGGKTGINLPSGKNLAGTFYFPTAVVVDPSTLTSLPERELRSGLGEIIKYALIEDTVAASSDYRRGPRSLWRLLQDTIKTGTNDLDEGALAGIITACIKMKLAVVAKDPHEGSLRRSLNLGHTLGHAVEKVSNFKYSHGEAVAIGSVFACRLSEHLGKLAAEETAAVVQLLTAAELPTAVPADLQPDALLQAMSFDKKREGNTIKWVLPDKTLGTVDLNANVSSDVVKELL